MQYRIPSDANLEDFCCAPDYHYPYNFWRWNFYVFLSCRIKPSPASTKRLILTYENIIYERITPYILPLLELRWVRHAKFFPRVILLCLYREPQPENPRWPHTTGPKPHKLKTPTPKTLFKTQTPNDHK